jgi:hypothetical protein
VEIPSVEFGSRKDTTKQALLWGEVVRFSEARRVAQEFFNRVVLDVATDLPTYAQLSRLDVAGTDRQFAHEDFMRAVKEFSEHVNAAAP